MKETCPFLLIHEIGWLVGIKTIWPLLETQTKLAIRGPSKDVVPQNKCS